MRRQDYQRQIDEEITNELSVHARRILELKTRRNTFADVSTLPNELLLEIFVFVRYGLVLEDWHHITHVCRRWRAVAINAPTLWTAPPTRLHKYTCLMLERSGMAGLDISLRPPINTVTVDSISEHAVHIKNLDLYLRTRELDEVCYRLTSSGHTLSLLRSLHVTDSNNAYGNVPWALIPNHCPLSELYLWHVTFDWRMLTTFDLVSVQLIDAKLTEKVSTSTLLDALRRMPRLEQLSFSADCVLLPHHTPSEVEQVHLPRLRQLHIEECLLDSMSHLLAHLELPTLDDLMLEASEDSEIASYSPGLLAPITKTITGGDFQAGVMFHIDERDIEISVLKDTLVSLKLWPGPDDDDLDIYRPRILCKHVAPFFNNLIEVHLETPIESGDLVRAFGNLRQLQRLTICRYESLVPSLADAMTSRSGDGYASLFPALRRIHCEFIAWTDLSEDQITSFCDALLRRSRHAWDHVVWAKPRLPDWIFELLDGGGVQVKNDDLDW